MKIITLCGSLRFQEYMMRIAEEMALLGNCILTPIYPTSKNSERTKEQLEMLKEEHFKKIELKFHEKYFNMGINRLRIECKNS